MSFLLLREYRCKICGKLLCKGLLNHSDSLLEVKCRGCGGLSLFRGQDAEIIKTRAELIHHGLIPDTDKEV